VIYELDDTQRTTIAAALVHYALHIADPTMVASALDVICPEPNKPWPVLIAEARADYALQTDRMIDEYVG